MQARFSWLPISFINIVESSLLLHKANTQLNCSTYLDNVKVSVVNRQMCYCALESRCQCKDIRGPLSLRGRESTAQSLLLLVGGSHS